MSNTDKAKQYLKEQFMSHKSKLRQWRHTNLEHDWQDYQKTWMYKISIEAIEFAMEPEWMNDEFLYDLLYTVFKWVSKENMFMPLEYMGLLKEWILNYEPPKQNKP